MKYDYFNFLNKNFEAEPCWTELILAEVTLWLSQRTGYICEKLVRGAHIPQFGGVSSLKSLETIDML